MKKVLRAKIPMRDGVRLILLDENQMCVTIRRRGKDIDLPVIRPPEDEELIEWDDFVHPVTLEESFEEIRSAGNDLSERSKVSDSYRS